MLEGMTTTSATPAWLTKVNLHIMDCDCPNIEAIIGGEHVVGILIDGESGMNIISMAVC
jgi:hypothetical protein